jgi:hypothetical protein
MFLSINMISYGRNTLSMDIELFIVRIPQAFKFLIFLRLDSPNFLRGKRSSSFPTDVCRIAPNLIPWSLRKNKTVLFKVASLLISSKNFKYIASAFLVAAK